MHGMNVKAERFNGCHNSTLHKVDLWYPLKANFCQPSNAHPLFCEGRGLAHRVSKSRASESSHKRERADAKANTQPMVNEKYNLIRWEDIGILCQHCIYGKIMSPSLTQEIQHYGTPTIYQAIPPCPQGGQSSLVADKVKPDV